MSPVQHLDPFPSLLDELQMDQAPSKVALPLQADLFVLYSKGVLPLSANRATLGRACLQQLSVDASPTVRLFIHVLAISLVLLGARAIDVVLHAPAGST